MTHTVPFCDLARNYRTVQTEVDVVLNRALECGQYILGTEVHQFEQEFARSCGAQHCVGVANGSDALYLALKALNIGNGDEVITVSNGCIYQTEAIIQTGAQPILIDVDPLTATLDPHALTAAITPRTRAVLPVHLYGRMADMEAINAIAAEHSLVIVEDAAQAHGAWRTNADGEPQRAGTWGHCTCFSFYPTKNLGALGDGGAVVTNDADLADRLRWMRQYGWSSKYVLAEKGGRNSRLDELQAAILRVKLRHLERWNMLRRERAGWYHDLLHQTPLHLPPDEPGHVYHLYVVATEQRESLRHFLTAAGIGTDIHYPLPAHLQPAYASGPGTVRPYGMGVLPHTERLARRVLSLPLYPELTQDEAEQVATAIATWSSQHTK